MMKYVKGEVLSADHWHELFRMLSMPRGTTLEQLTFGDILGAADNILANMDGLKVSLFHWYIVTAVGMLYVWRAGYRYDAKGKF